MKDYRQVTNDVFRKRDEYLERRKKRMAYIEKGVSIMSITGILVALGICTSLGSTLSPGLSEEPSEIDLSSGISTVTSQTSQTSQTSTEAVTSTGSVSSSAETTSAVTEGVITSAADVLTTAAETTVSSEFTAAATAASETVTTAESTENNESASDEGIVITVALREKGTMSDTVYVDSAELDNGDYTFKASVCLETDDSLQDMLHFNSEWDAVSENGLETPFIRTENAFTYSEKWNDDRTNRILEEADASSYSYVTGAGVTADPYAAGPGKIYIEDQITGELVFYDLTINKETGAATVDLPRLRGGDPFTITFHHYDPETPYGELIPMEQNKMSIHCLSGFSEAWTTEKINGLNEMGYFDVIIDQDTLDGVYYLQLQNAYMHGSGMNVIAGNINASAENGIYTTDSDPAYWLKIVVGDSAEAAETAEVTGDVNLDGAVSLDDATDVLRIYAEAAAGINSGVQILQSTSANADVNADGKIDLDDAVSILTYYARKAAGLSAEW